jgi:hypothetical protein
MDDLFLKRVLFECIRDRQKEQTHSELVYYKPLALVKQVPDSNGRYLFFLYEPIYASSHVLKKDYPCSDLKEKTPRPLN